MTDEEVLEYYKKLEEYYGEKLVNPEHYPYQFRNQLRLYRYYKSQQHD